MAKFWQTKALTEMTKKEWESLCDGCGKCCLNKIEYQDTQEMVYTRVACRLFDPKTCRCRDYKSRKKEVKDCLELTPRKLETIDWLPASCSYRLVAEGKDLPDWHHLKTKDRNAIHREGHSLKDRRIVIEDDQIDLEDHLVDWEF